MMKPKGEAVLRWTIFALLLLLAESTQAQSDARAYPPKMPDAEVEVYKTCDEVKLNLYIFNPENHSSSEKKAAIVFFFGGGWRSGSPGQFKPQCEQLASLGMVAITADYRVASRNGVKANTCVADAKSAIRWVRANSSRLGIDPKRIVASGGSAGGHLAVSTALLPGFDEPGEDPSISSAPDALVLFNPAVMLAPFEGKTWPRLENLGNRLGADPEAISPIHHVRKGLPPTIIFHGEADQTIPFSSVRLFTEKMTEASNKCTLVGFENKGHGFFNYRDGQNSAYSETMEATTKFLSRLGYLP